MKWYHLLTCLAGILAFLVVSCNVLVGRSGRYTYDSIAALPSSSCALLLGTSKFLRDGRENLYYRYRIDAAARLYHAGKCKKIVVSGDNRTHGYNEPVLMRRDLIRLGVKPADIVCDFAGLRTLDSVIRFKQVFGQHGGIVVSQRFHNSRAIYVARHHGIALVGYNAQDVGRYSGIKTRLRELASKCFCVLDVHVFKTRPRHLGPAIAIES